MKTRRRWHILLLIGLFAVVLAACQSCAPAAAPTSAPAAEKPVEKPTEAPAAAPTQSAGEVQKTGQPPSASATPPGPAAPTSPAEPTLAPLIESRTVELEWPEQVRMGESDVIRLALVPSKEGYVARAEFPDHTVQSKPVVVPRPNGYELYAIARLDGVGFEIAPTGDQEVFLPEGEEIAWRWTLSPRSPGQQRLSVILWLRWVPAEGVTGTERISQVFSRGLNVQVRSFLGMSPPQAASTGLLSLLAGSGFLLAALVGARGKAALKAYTAPGALQVTRPNPEVHIETPPNLTLTGEEGGLLRGLFSGYSRLVIENEFLSGYSGARTFLVRPIRADGRADALTIVKLGPRESIRQEFRNYEDFVKDRLPPMTARIQRAPVILEGAKQRAVVNPRAAVQYTFIAEPGRPPVSLRQALLNNPEPGLLLRLFETFGPSWWMQRSPFIFRLGLEYDRLLPPHYVLERVDEGRANARIALSEDRNPGEVQLAVGDTVLLQAFHQAEMRADGQSYSLIGRAAAGCPALRLRWIGASLPGSQVRARITATRSDLLRGWTARFDRFGLPDPLLPLENLLEETVNGTRTVIHGDLNLENVLVGPGSLVWMIDFAQTREGHPLFDFAHLESELIAHVLASRFASPEEYLHYWQSNSDTLIQTVHEIAGRCMFDLASPREYRLALYMACLGALKYQNLSSHAKHCLYLTAAAQVKKLATAEKFAPFEKQI